MSLSRFMALGSVVFLGCATDPFGGDSGTDAGTDAAVTDSGITSDGGTPGDAADAGPRCPFDGGIHQPCAVCASTETCCLTPAGTGSCTGACNTGNIWQCFSPGDCGGGSLSCCLSTTAGFTPTCPHAISAPASTLCLSGCTQRKLCVVDSDCPQTHACEAYTFGLVTIGLCG